MKIFFFILLTIFLKTHLSAQTTDTAFNKANNDSLGKVLSKDRVFTSIEIEAEFIGGDNAWKTFISKNLKPDIPSNNGAPVGKYTVYANFVIDTEGNLTEIKFSSNPGYGCNEEVERILKKSPKWKPAMQRGIKVKSYKRQPITFVVS